MAEIPEVDVDELEDLIAAGFPLFDVRQPDEYLDGHVSRAVLVPLAEVGFRVSEFPTEVSVYVICRSGARSAQACEVLRSNGVDAINVQGGTLGWTRSGRDVVFGEHPE